MKIYPVCIGGLFKELPETIEVRNPYNDEPLALCSLAGTTQLEEAIAAALAVEKEMATMPSYRKSEILNGIAEGMLKEREQLSTLLAQEACKPIKYAVGEVDRAIQTFRIAAEECKRLPTEYISLDWTPAGKGKEGLVKYFPVGLIAGISPFNFPLNLVVHKIAPAIAAGCPIILKPARSTPLSALELARIAYTTSLPAGALSILPMDRVSGNQLVTDPRFKLLSFTGSPAVGWKMKEMAGRKRVVLELGGNAGVIVTQTADIEKALAKCISGAFAYSGQVCIHTQRIYIHTSVFNTFVESMAKLTKKLIIGNPLDPQTDISAMIDQENALRVEEWVNESLKGGARIVTGGHRKGNIYEPTILTGTNAGMKVCSHEVFGPIVIVEPYSHFEEAINAINDSPFGLQAGIFTNQLD
ncbi:MAG TPA: aldehyde dehydrogenase family protein, partial [Tenuifilaceae bacterium]|nr:aldehyde dehydrogenase family protein [Tenuifilaceae bacterium]HPW27400.1 aldehyde dehydrogenase family protein [Tenuifilaceae bacterium]